MPMTTMLSTRPPSSRQASMTWSTISPLVRFRTSPFLPLAQKTQRTGHPTWVERQTVVRSGTRMRTVSTVFPSSRRESHFTVPSSGSWRRSTTSRAKEAMPASSRLRRSPLGRLDISS